MPQTPTSYDQQEAIVSLLRGHTEKLNTICFQLTRLHENIDEICDFLQGDNGEDSERIDE